MSYINPGQALSMGIVFPTVGIILLISRFLVRGKRETIGIDDWLSIPAYLGILTIGIIYMYGYATKTIGYHSPAQSSSQYLNAIAQRQTLLEHLEYVILVVGPITTGFIRLSVLFMYLRLFVTRTFKILSWTLISLSLAWTMSFTFASVFECPKQVDAAWGTVGELETKCVNTVKLLRALTVSDFLINIMILALPVPFVLRLHMPTPRKIALLGVFAVGSAAVAAGIARLVIVIKLTAGSLTDISGVSVSPDDEFGIINISLFWIYMELGIANAAICLPPLRLPHSDRSINSIVRSARSMVSLRSWHSSSNANNESKTPRKAGVPSYGESTLGGPKPTLSDDAISTSDSKRKLRTVREDEI